MSPKVPHRRCAMFPCTFHARRNRTGANLPPEIPFVLDIILAVFILTRAYKSMGTMNNQEEKVALSIGLVFPIAVFVLIASIGLANPLIIVADLFFILLSRRLWRKWHQWTLLHRSALQTSLPGFGASPAPLFP